MSNTLKLIYQADRVDDESRFSFFKQINPIETKLRQGFYTAALQKTSESVVQSVKTCYQAFGNRFQHQLHLKSAFRRAGFEYLPLQSQLFCHASV